MRCNSLTSKQKEAIDYLSRGWNSTETCEFLKIHIATLWRWKKQANFKAELDNRINKQKQVVANRVIELIDRSKDVLLEALDSKANKLSGCVKVALEILKIYKPPLEEEKETAKKPLTDEQRRERKNKIVNDFLTEALGGKPREIYDEKELDEIFGPIVEDDYSI